MSACRRHLLLAGTSGLVMFLGYASAEAQNVTLNSGQTVTVPGSQLSPWNVGGGLFIYNANLLVNSGGMVTVGGNLALTASPVGGNLIDVSGIGTELHIGGTTNIGGFDSTLRISNGAIVDSGGSASIGGVNTSNTLVEVSDARWDITGGLVLADYGRGSLRIINGGEVTAASLYTNFVVNVTTNTVAGYIEVSGGSKLTVTNGFIVGNYHTGIMQVTGGSIVTSGGSAAVGWAAVGSDFGEVEISGLGSLWDHSGSMSVGQNGNGILRIINQGVVKNTAASIGISSAGNGYVEVSDIGSRWENSGFLNIGHSSGLSLLVTNGGVVTSIGASIGVGSAVGGVATDSVEVSGNGSRWENNGFLEVGKIGFGTLEILNGGFVETAGAVIRVNSAIEVSGANSQLDVHSGTLEVNGYFGGNNYAGLLHVRNGGLVTTAGTIIGAGVSPQNGQSGEVEVTGAGSRWSDSSNIVVGGAWGGGSLLIGSGGTVSAPSVDIALTTTSLGALVIGGWTNWGAEAPGTLSTTSVTFGTGSIEALIIFNHTSSHYVFDATINNGADNAAGSGTGLVGPGVVRAYAGRTILNADHGDFTGMLQADTRGILQINGDMSNATVEVHGGGTLEGHGVVGETYNAGIIAPGGSIGTLTIAGDYISGRDPVTGSRGALMMEVVLGDDHSPADRLVITGDVLGRTAVRVINVGGLGAQTVNGIPIIDVGGTSLADDFVLVGDYITADGQQAVIGGAYAYTLQANGDDTAGRSWYLSSALVPVDPEQGMRYQPGTVVYEQYPQVLAALNTVPTLQQRVGNRYWSPAGTAPGGVADNRGMWGRIEGSRMAFDPARSTTGSHRDVDLWRLQTGLDFALHEGGDGSLLMGGVNISYGTAKAEMGSPVGRGKIDATGYGFGTSLTWYGAGGFYVDGQAQVMLFDSDLTSTTEGRRLTDGNSGHGLAFSVETGKRYGLGRGLFVTPQVQLVYAKVDFDSFTDPFRTRVSLKDGDSLRARIGVSLDHEASWVAADGRRSRSHVYGGINLYNEFLDGSKVEVSGVGFSTRDERLWVGLGLGGTYEWANGAYALYGHANLASSTGNFGDNYAINGSLGFRASW